MNEDLMHCLDEEHSNDKKVTFEYPENDIDDEEPIKENTVKVERPIVKEVEKENTSDEDTADLSKELEKEIDENDMEEDFVDSFEEPKKRNTLIIILASFLLILLIAGGIFWLIMTKEVEDVTVPNIVNLTVEEAITKLEEKGFTYTTEQKNSETVEEGKVIKTSPRGGSNRHIVCSGCE